MESWGLVVHDEQTFLAKVVNLGIDEGIVTGDKVDEIIRISVAMANKYVLQKEIDFRSQEELAKVQETVIRLLGIGLEIKAKGIVEEGVRLLIDASPVDLFRLAYTRIEKLREHWKQLLLDHRIEILVPSRVYQSLSELTRHQLSEMSVFTEGELYTIRSLTMEDNLFTTLSVLEYYESELERYESILRMRQTLPFDLLNRSTSLNVENLAELDSLREGLINTVVVSAVVDGEDPVTLSMEEVRRFLQGIDLAGDSEVFTQEMEDVVIDLIQELAEDLEEREAALFTKEFVETTRKLIETLVNESDTVNSSSEITFFKRWTRMAILRDAPDPIERILTSDETIDDFDFEILVEKLAGLDEGGFVSLVERLPWDRMIPEQIIRLFDQLHYFQRQLAKSVSLSGFRATNLVDLLDTVDSEVVDLLAPALQEALGEATLTLEDLELIVAPPHTRLIGLLWNANPPEDMDAKRALFEFKDGGKLRQEVLLCSCMKAAFYPELFAEAWDADPSLVKRISRTLPAEALGLLLLAAAGRKPKVGITPPNKEPTLDFEAKAVNMFFRSLPMTRKKAAVSFFTQAG